MDINHFWGGDAAVSPTGDLALADGDTLAQQSLLRALMTNPALNDQAGNPFASPDYTFHAQWGAGVPRLIGRPLGEQQLRAQIISTMKGIAGIARTPEPVVTIAPFPNGGNGAAISIQYVDAQTGRPSTLSFDINQ